MVITGLTRNQVARKGSWVRIPPPPPNRKALIIKAFRFSYTAAIVSRFHFCYIHSGYEHENSDYIRKNAHGFTHKKAGGAFAPPLRLPSFLQYAQLRHDAVVNLRVNGEQRIHKLIHNSPGPYRVLSGYGP